MINCMIYEVALNTAIPLTGLQIPAQWQYQEATGWLKQSQLPPPTWQPMDSNCPSTLASHCHHNGLLRVLLFGLL